MTEKNYALIKDGVVYNVVIFDDPTEEVLNLFKEENDLDQIVLANERSEVFGTYDGEKFWRVQLHPSWVKNNETNEWEAPVPYPERDPENPIIYRWDEESISWIAI